MTSKIILMISGKAGVGKSTLAEVLLQKIPTRGLHCSRFPLGFKIKQIAANEFDWNWVKDEKGRQLLIDIGNAGRAFDPTIWAKKVFAAIEKEKKENDLFLVDDWRFEAESDFLCAAAGYKTYKIRVFAPKREILKDTAIYEDASENSLPEFLSSEEQNFYDFAINNDGDLAKLEFYAQRMIDTILADSKKNES